jgi:DNA-binding IclR family transcriptional regulator
VGKAMLAATAPADVRAMLARTGLPARTERTLTEISALLEQLRSVRARGFAVDDQENEANIRCIGAAILGHRDLPLASISVSSHVYDLNGPKVARCAQLVTGAARQIAQSLGHS